MHQQQGFIELAGNKLNYTVKRSRKRRKTLSMMMHPQRGVIVSVPWRTSTAELQNFIHAQKSWLLASMHQLKTLPRYTFTTGEQLAYLGEACCLKVTQNETQAAGCKYTPGNLTVTLPNATRSAVYKTLKAWYTEQAYQLLPARLNYWQQRMGLVYTNLVINDSKSEWGCCEANNTIRINWRVMLMSWEVIDYLLVHELSHVQYKDHSKNFWKLVGSVLPDYKALRCQLREHPAGHLSEPCHPFAATSSPPACAPIDHTTPAVWAETAPTTNHNLLVTA